MKAIFCSIALSLSCATVFAAPAEQLEPKARLSGKKAEAVFRSLLATDESLIDGCTAHSCELKAVCHYQELSRAKYVCIVTSPQN